MKSHHTTVFQQKVYNAVSLIPKGRVTTYSQIARFIQCNSSQAIGQALKRNPFAPDIPCHRVIKSDLTIGGFKGKKSGPEIFEKINLLTSEGVKIKDGVVTDPQQLYYY